MPISRLENFLRSPKGTVIYVDPNSFDSTDSFENRGDSATRPFKTIQRALIEAARFSYQVGLNNDLNDRTTILVSSGIHYIDNRPGFSITNLSGSSVFKKRTGINTWTVNTLNEFTGSSNFDIFDSNNDLYKFNSTEGGVILPRGTSIVGLDLRKTKIKPLYVPDPIDNDIERSSIFKVTGNCYFTSFTFFDADLANGVYKNYTEELVIPRFSHHKLTAFTYADGVNKVKLGLEQTDLTDLQMYYYKVAKAYGTTSGRSIPDYPTNTDIEPIIDEYRIVGLLEEDLIGISSIRSGNGLGGGILNEITVTTKDLITNLDAPHNLNENVPILISGVSVNPSSYNGAFTVKSIVGPNTFTYVTSSIPSTKLPSTNQIDNAIIKVESDSTSSSSPYIFNCSLRSSYGMCGLWADGSKADGFKSAVVAQFTGISLQKDDNAFLIYSKSNKNYIKNNQLSGSSTERPLHTNSSAIYDPNFENFHIKASNNSFIQCVSIFAIGFAKHFVTETGGDMSITNSNSNFGALALESYGFRNKSFDRDDVGYITHVIPPREISLNELDINWVPLDVGLTTSVDNNDDKFLYLYGYNDVNVLPPYKIDGYKIGAKINDTLSLILDDSTDVYQSPIYMQPRNGEPIHSSKKEYKVVRNINGTNSISSSEYFIQLTSNHKLITGEKVRIFSDTGQAPDGLELNTIYYAISYSSTSIQLAYNYNDAIAEIPITDISNNGGILTVISSVSDKIPGEPGHPIQWNSTKNNWYLISSPNNSANKIYERIKDLGENKIGSSTIESYFSRYIDNRTLEDRLYKIRYVIPKNYLNIRPPTIGFIIQESSSVGITPISVDTSADLTVLDQKNEKIISSISAGSISNNSQLVTVETELPHRLLAGDKVLIKNVKSTYNPNSTGITSSFNGSYEVSNIIDSRTFNYSISGVSTNPGIYTNNIKTRNSSTLSSLPVVSRQEYKNTFIVYRVDTIKKHIPGDNGQDGIYHLTVISSNVKTNSNLGYGLSTRNYNQDVRNLYPQIDQDNLILNPEASISYADHLVPGRVITNDKRNSLTKESIEYFIQNNVIGFGITNLTLSGTGNTTITIQTDIEHKLNSIKTVSIYSNGTEPDGDYYGSPITIGGNPTDAKCNYKIISGVIDIDSINFIDSGSAFTETQQVGIGTLGGIATIEAINSNILDGLQLSGFSQKEFNDVFKIINIPNSKTIILESTNSLPNYTLNTNQRIPFGYISSKGINISSFDFSDITTGIVTVTTSESHGLNEGNNFKVVGSGTSLYDSTFVVNSVIDLSTFTFNVGIATTNPSSSQGVLFKKALYPNSKSTGKSGENIPNRINYIFSGVSTTSIFQTNFNNNVLVFKDVISHGFERGDYAEVNGEIIRLTKKTGSDTFNIERGMFGTIKKDIPEDSRINKIKIIPVELRRPSFMRASGHTFEYLGYGPGNYSTAIPQKQSRKLTEDEVIVSQSRKISGGTIVYSGMNDIGEFYNGATKLSAITGQETTVEAPIITFTGGDIDGTDDPNKTSGFFDNVLIRQKLTVEGGENNKETSIFYGPVRFQNTVKFDKGLSLNILTLGNQRFKSGAKPLQPFNADIIYTGVSTSNIGKIYLGTNGWKRWGLVSKSENRWDVDLNTITVKEIEVTDKLTINGVKFGNNNTIDSLKITDLNVNGISTFKGSIYGNTQGIVSFRDAISVSNDDNVGISTLYLRGNGRIIDIGSTPTEVYSLRLIREINSGSLLDTDSRILHIGAGKLEIKSLNNSGSISITNSGISTLSLLSSDSGGIVQVSRSNNGNGSGGAHLSILNTNSLGDAVLSWRSGNKPYWLSGVDTSDSNTWKIAVSSNSTIGITNQNFTVDSTKVGIDTNGAITLTNGEIKVRSGILSVTDAKIDGELNYKIKVGAGLTGNDYKNTEDITLAIKQGGVDAKMLSGGQQDNAAIFGARAWGKMIDGTGNSIPKIKYGGGLELEVEKISTGRYRITMFNKLQNNEDRLKSERGVNESTWDNQDYIIIANLVDTGVNPTSPGIICSCKTLTTGSNDVNVNRLGKFEIYTRRCDTGALVDTESIFFAVYG